MSERVTPIVVHDRGYLDLLWEELKAAIIVRWRVETPEVNAEVARAKRALLIAMGEVDSS